MNGAHLFLCSNLSHALIERADVDVHDLNALIVIDVKFFIDDFRRSLDSE